MKCTSNEPCVLWPRLWHALRIRLFALGLLLLLVALLSKVVMRYGVQLAGRASEINFYTLTLAFLIYPFYNILNAHGWGMGLRALGARVSTLAGIRIWLLSEAAKWLPGSIWGQVSRVFLARKAGVDSLQAAASLPLELLLTLIAWMLTAVIGLWVSGAGQVCGRELGSLRSFSVAVSAAIVAFAAGYLFIHYSHFKVARSVREKIQRFRMLRELRPRPVGVALTCGYYVGLCVFNGLVFHLLIHAVSKQAAPPVLASIGMNSAAWLFGFGVFIAPAGLGAREAALGFLLSYYLPADEAALTVVLWRLVQLSAEALWLTAVVVPPLIKGVPLYPMGTEMSVPSALGGTK